MTNYKRQWFSKILSLKRVLNVSEEMTLYFCGALLLTILYGLLINTISLKIGLKKPLSFTYMWPCFFFFLFFFVKVLRESINCFNISLKKWPLFLLLLFNPLLAIAGAIYLDNTGSGVVTVISTIITSCTLLATYLQRNTSPNIMKPALYSAGLSLMLSNSMRSSYLVGYDIHQEYLVFRLTVLHNFWNINTFKDAYNACLSITILPTIIHNLTGIAPMTIMKLIYPMIIAFLPVIVFQIGEKLSNPKIAFAGAFAFLLQAQFATQLPAITRQGIAFLFFAAMIDILLSRNHRHITKNIIFMLFGIGVIFSHYSTTYVMLFIIAVAKLVSIAVNKIWKYKSNRSALSTLTILTLFVAAFFWNVLITETARGLKYSLEKASSSMQQIFTLENRSDVVRSITYMQSDNQTEVVNYSQESIKKSTNPSFFKQYEVIPINLNSSRPIKISDPVPLYFHVIIPWLFRTSILIGFIYIVWYEYKYRQSTLVLGLAIAMFGITFLIAVLPSVSLDYNFERLFQQVLILLAPICAIGFYALLTRFPRSSPSIIIAVILVSYLFQTSGLIDNLFYSQHRWALTSGGETYYRYYTTKEEIYGIKWLNNNVADSKLLYADRYSQLRINSYFNHRYSYISSEINPPKIDLRAYLFAGNAANSANAVFAKIDNKSINFSFPRTYLSLKQDVIYSNSKVKIYR